MIEKEEVYSAADERMGIIPHLPYLSRKCGEGDGVFQNEVAQTVNA